MTIKKAAIIISVLSSMVFSFLPTDSIYTNYKGIKFVKIRSGNFEMGFEGRRLNGTALYGQYGDSLFYGIYNERPQHTVKISQDFYMAQCEIKNSEFKLFRPNHGSQFIYYNGNEVMPVRQVTWAEADSFCKWLTMNDPGGYQYRLPTEAEWEYCCRAGTTTWYSFGDTILGSYASMNSGLWGWNGVPVGLYPANKWGLYDMHGNVKEWCLDWIGPYTSATDTNPGGYVSGFQKVLRGFPDNGSSARAAMRGSLPPVCIDDPMVGFRVVISELTADSLRFKQVLPSTEQASKNVAPSLPAPSTTVSGATWTDPDGMVFSRVRMLSTGYPSQWDSVVYVSTHPVSGDSGANTRLAGIVAKTKSTKHGVLYRLTNKYERLSASLPSDSIYFTIVPDIRYRAGDPHPSVTFMQFRKMYPVPTDTFDGGPFFHNVNHVPQLGESPNGDLLCSWYSGESEDCFEQNTAVRRLRYGDTTWDSLPSVSVDFAGYMELAAYGHNGNGRLFQAAFNWIVLFNTYSRYSDDNGLTWSQWSNGGGVPMQYYGKDTLMTIGDYALFSTDGGMTYNQSTAKIPGFNRSTFIGDDGSINIYVRGADLNNTDGKATLGSYHSNDRGATFSMSATPFFPPGIGMCDVGIKLHSGRWLFAVTAQGTYPEHCALVVSDDTGKTWYCRHILSENPSTRPFLRHHKAGLQGRDDIIHLVSSYGSGTGDGSNPHIAFSESWLDSGKCLNVALWGINTAGMVSGCPDVVSSEGVANEEPQITVEAIPNPFNPTTRLFYSLPVENIGILTIYAADGKKIKSIKAAGSNSSVLWDGCDEYGKRLGSGLYFCRLVALNSAGIKQSVINRIVMLR